MMTRNRSLFNPKRIVVKVTLQQIFLLLLFDENLLITKRLSMERVYPPYKPYSISKTSHVIFRICHPFADNFTSRVGCFVEDIPVKQMVRDQFSEEEFNFVWLEFFYALHYHKCKKQRCWTVKFTSNKKVPINYKELTSFSKIRKQKIAMKINTSKVDI